MDIDRSWRMKMSTGSRSALALSAPHVGVSGAPPGLPGVAPPLGPDGSGVGASDGGTPAGGGVPVVPPRPPAAVSTVGPPHAQSHTAHHTARTMPIGVDMRSTSFAPAGSRRGRLGGPRSDRTQAKGGDASRPT